MSVFIVTGNTGAISTNKTSEAELGLGARYCLLRLHQAILGCSALLTEGMRAPAQLTFDGTSLSGSMAEM